MDHYVYDFDKAYEAWARLPVDDFDYMDANEILMLELPQIKELISLVGHHRWNQTGWRNKDNKLIEFMNLSAVLGKTVMDFGCGFGIDSLMFLDQGAEVVLADIHPLNLYTAQKILCIMLNTYAKRLVIVRPTSPFFNYEGMDLFWSFGVLHHTPYAGEILETACAQLAPGGECRVGLYSDKRWEEMMKEPVSDDPVWKHPRFDEFVRKNDTVGHYADWYHEEKLQKLVEKFAVVTECSYMCNDQFIAAVIKPKIDP